MAYNLQPLITTLEQILNPQQTRWVLDNHSKPQLQSLLQKAASLQQILEKSSSLPKTETSLDAQIREASHEAEDIVERYMVGRILSDPQATSLTFSAAPDMLQQVTRQLDSVIKLTGERPMTKSGGSSSSSGASFPSFKSGVVGLDNDLLELKGRLTGTKGKLEIVPIVGMGGIGKTTLARKLYEDPLIVSRFHIRAWSTVSQDYNMQAVLLSLIGEKSDEKHQIMNVGELKDMLHTRLYGKRYMIVLDDVWSPKFWDDIRRFFPDNSNGSRIVLTTRESAMAKHAGSQSLQHQLYPLSKAMSWKLLRKIVFGKNKKCPDFLKGTGKKISKGCGGLPLAINVIGGLLSKIERSRDAWENIANDMKTAISQSNDKQFSSLLSLSYDHLSDHLKPCLLYMGAFPEDHPVKGTKLIRLWVAEGFVKRNGSNGKSLEEEAEGYLNSLVERNLLMMVKKNKKWYGVHDLVRDLCVEKADEERFLHVVTNSTKARPFSNPRRVSLHGTTDAAASAESIAQLARSFISVGNETLLSPFFSALSLVRVLDVKKNKFKEFPRAILELVNLRYLGVACTSRLPSEISRLWDLQTLIAETDAGEVPSEIWELLEMRHLKLNKLISFDEQQVHGGAVQSKLQTISKVLLNARLIEIGFFESIPNVTDLRIKCGELPSRPVDLTRLLKLQTFRFKSRAGSDGRHALPMLRFSSSLKKLILVKCHIYAGVLAALRALPNLEVLKITKCKFRREETAAVEEEESWEEEEEAEGDDQFRSLRVLHLRHSDLVRWTADQTNFPSLCQLRLEGCHKLEEIPGGIGDILTLELIELKSCSSSAVESAKRILKVQLSDYGNDGLKLRIS